MFGTNVGRYTIGDPAFFIRALLRVGDNTDGSSAKAGALWGVISQNGTSVPHRPLHQRFGRFPET